MAQYKFHVGMRVRARHNIIEADYHKGDRTLAREGQEGEVTNVYRRYDGRQGLHVRFGRYSECICDDWDVEPAGPLDAIVSGVFGSE